MIFPLLFSKRNHNFLSTTFPSLSEFVLFYIKLISLIKIFLRSQQEKKLITCENFYVYKNADL